MKHYAGLDVSVKETSICIVDETGKICRELKVPSYPEDLLRVLQVSTISDFDAVGNALSDAFPASASRGL